MSADTEGIAGALVAIGMRVPLELPSKFVTTPLTWSWRMAASGGWATTVEMELNQLATSPTANPSSVTTGARSPIGVAQIFGGTVGQPLNCKAQFQAFVLDIYTAGEITAADLATLQDWIRGSYFRTKVGKEEIYQDLAPFIRLHGPASANQGSAAPGLSLGTTDRPWQKLSVDGLYDFSDGDVFAVGSEGGGGFSIATELSFVLSVAGACYDKDANITWKPPTAAEARLQTEGPGAPGDF